MKAFTYRNEGLLSTAFLIMRVVLGIIMFAHGAQKVLGAFGGKGLDAAITGMSEHTGIPVPLAYLSVFTEFLGGAALVLGIATRFFAAGNAINMLVAIFAVHLGNGFFSQGGGFEYPLALTALALGVFLAGPGAYSLDHLLWGSDRTMRARTSSSTISTGRVTRPV